MNSFRIYILVLSLTALFISCNKEKPGNQKEEKPEIELVESIPVETSLGDVNISKTKDVWLEMINSAKKSLDFEQYYISSKPGEPMEDIINAIIKAGERGVMVRIIVDEKMYYTYPESVNMLSTRKNIECRIVSFGALTGGIQHAKYFIVDSSQIFIGSQNFDWRSLKHIHEIGLRIKHSGIVNMYREVFEHDWKFAEKNQSYPEFTNTDVTIKSFSFSTKDYDSLTLIPTFSPEKYIPVSANGDEKQITRLIYNAKQNIMLQFLTYNPATSDNGYYGLLDSALILASKRGIKVKLIVSDWSIGKLAIDYLKKLSAYPNIEVKYSSIPDAKEGYIPFARVEHCKYIVADSTVCWIGSSNAEKSYFYNSRDAGVTITNKKLTTQLYDIFMKDWNGEYTHPIKPGGEYKPREHGEKIP